jgi:hypothetical protein
MEFIDEESKEVPALLSSLVSLKLLSSFYSYY